MLRKQETTLAASQAERMSRREGEGKQEGGANPFSAFSKGVPGARQAVGKLGAGWDGGTGSLLEPLACPWLLSRRCQTQAY